MRAVVQRVKEASLRVEGKLVSKIPFGLAVFFGVKAGDTQANADYIAKKVAGLRIFEDENGKMNLSVRDVGGEVLLISQFTRRFARQQTKLYARGASRARRAALRIRGRKDTGIRRSRQDGRIRRGYENRTAQRRSRHHPSGIGVKPGRDGPRVRKKRGKGRERAKKKERCFMEGLSKEDFEKAMARLKEFKEILSQFENRESCVECLAAATGLSQDECAQAYDFCMRTDLSALPPEIR